MLFVYEYYVWRLKLKQVGPSYLLFVFVFVCGAYIAQRVGVVQINMLCYLFNTNTKQSSPLVLVSDPSLHSKAIYAAQIDFSKVFSQF